MNITIRLFFQKCDRAKYISHLDITRCFARAIARTDLPVWYTEGFNPRIYMTFPLPLSLGYESGCESLDLRLTDEEFPLPQVTEQLNCVLPEGIRILETCLPEQKPDTIALADYAITIGTQDPAALLAAFREFCTADSILVTKRTKKGDRELDIKPMMEVLVAEGGGEVLSLRLRLAAGITLNLSPTLLLDAFLERSGNPGLFYRVERTTILTADGQEWR